MVACTVCRKKIKNIEEPIKVKDGWNCQDCYYNELGNLIEKYPIVSVQRGKRRWK